MHIHLLQYLRISVSTLQAKCGIHYILLTQFKGFFATSLLFLDSHNIVFFIIRSSQINILNRIFVPETALYAALLQDAPLIN